jgi:hypothetical protein
MDTAGAATWLAALHPYQQTIVGVIGFGGVIITLIVNAIIGRRAERRRLAREASTLRAGLYAELELIRLGVASAVETLGTPPVETKTAAIPARPWITLHEEVLDKLVCLTPSEMGTVLCTHAAIKQAYDRLFLLADEVAHDGRYLMVPAHAFAKAKTVFEDQLEFLDDALKVLDKAEPGAALPDIFRTGAPRAGAVVSIP